MASEPARPLLRGWGRRKKRKMKKKRKTEKKKEKKGEARVRVTRPPRLHRRPQIPWICGSCG
jgi:hypothetical protein